ncbi:MULTISPECIES: hypothetical protein [Dysgonomonas]|uniref:hypothetical protein n=1 Tax=Dysgonomonas TaxID=156973 RepID=UPI001883E6B5|nr:hypothetical protein [Dysgonomonas sp. GY75]MBF0651767.1 hypothetical protein [Dysgonomonas sp. GY75]
MKKIYLYILAAITICLITASCDKDLPFPIDEVKRGVVIDILRVPGTDGVLSDGQTTGNYQVKLTIPTQQGDYSMMDHAQLLAVLNDGTKTTAQVVVDNITSFPSTISINMADVYGKFGKTSPALGETLNFTVNVVLKSGEVIPGWNPNTNVYNNQAFAGWQIEGRGLSYRVQYSVVCPFVPETTFVGTFQCTETSSYGNDAYAVTLSHHTGNPETIPAGVDPAKLYGIRIEPISPNIWEGAREYTLIWINTEDFSIVATDQPTGDDYQGNPATPVVWRFKDASVSTCTRQIKFTATPTIVGVGSYAAFTFTIKP